MKNILITLMIAAMLVVTGCSTTSTKNVKPGAILTGNSIADKSKVPPIKPGEVPVFGKVALVELVNRTYMPAKEIGGNIYLKKDGSDKTYKLVLDVSGEFGVFLPAGSYRMLAADVNGYTFMPSMYVNVPADSAAVYTGTISFDSTPTGVEQGTTRPLFAYYVDDEQAVYEQSVRQAAPDVDVKFRKSIFKPQNGIIPGRYSTQVFRSKDIETNLMARTEAVEEVVKGVIIVLPYIVNPIWIFTLL